MVALAPRLDQDLLGACDGSAPNGCAAGSGAGFESRFDQIGERLADQFAGCREARRRVVLTCRIMPSSSASGS